MASSLSYVQSAEEDLTCPLCLELFIDPHIPKLLDCPHVYCQPCLAKLLAGTKGKQTISCPECRKSTTVPDRNVANLKTNLRLRSLAEKHAKHLQKREQNEMLPNVPYCKDHDGERLHFYCLTCQVSVCQACLVLIHERPKHEIKSVKDVHSEKMKILETTIERNEELISNFRRNIQHITCCEQKINVHIKESEGEIDRVAAKAISDIKRQAQQLKRDVHSKNERMLNTCNKQKLDCERKMSELQNAVDDAKKILGVKTSLKYLEHHKKITKRFIDLETDRKAEMPDPRDDVVEYHLYQLTYDQNSNALQVASYGYNDMMLVNLGKIEVKVIRNLKLQQTYRFPHPITCVACGHGHVVVNMQSKKRIEVYKHNAGKLTERQCHLVPTEKDWHPFDVAVTKDGNKILVARWNCVEVFTFHGKHVKTISMNRDSKYESITCSVTTSEDGHILVGDDHCHSIERYTSGKLVNNISPYVTPWKLKAIGNDYVAASNLENGVCTHPLSGTLAYFYWTNPVKIMGLRINIPNPTALCYDKETECLLIGCQDINDDGAVIEQYCWRTGAKIATLARGLKNPQDMAITDDGEYLVVADEDTLKFYKLSVETLDVDGKILNSYNSNFPFSTSHLTLRRINDLCISS